MATRKRHSLEQIARKLIATDRLLVEGKDTEAVCRKLKDLERENAMLMRLVADAELKKDVFREIAKGNF